MRCNVFYEMDSLEKLSLIIKTTLFSACSVISTLLAASNEPRSMFNSSRSISIATGRRIPFSFTLKPRLSRGIWRDAILSLEIASWREHRNGKYERWLSGIPVQNRKNNYTKSCQKDNNRKGYNKDMTLIWTDINICMVWKLTCLDVKSN